MDNLLQYSFVLRGLEAGIVVALVAPLIGIFLVLRRFSLIADTLAHVSLAGVAVGLFFGLNPFLTAIGTAVLSSIAIDRLVAKKVYGESALAMFLSGSLAFAIILVGLSKGFTVNLFNYLFGSILTVSQTDVVVIAGLSIVVFLALSAFFKELIYITFDEESAFVSGIPTKLLNLLFIALTALTIALAIPIVGVLLISALIVIPVVTALRFRRSFRQTLLIAEALSVFSVVSGITASFYLNLSSGGSIVLIALMIFLLTLLVK